MRPEKNPLDLNNLPEDYYSRDGKQVFNESSPCAGHRRKKSGAKDGKDESGKVYECRFCALKFCKSQALGGHMNRHRQERETETLNKARQLVFHNDHNLAPPHLGCHPITPARSYHPAGQIGDPSRSVYPPRLFSASSSTIISPPPPPPPPPPQPPQYPPYPSPSRLTSYPSHYPPPQPHAMNEYYVGHVLNSSPHSQYPSLNNYMGAPAAAAAESNYTCIGAPVGHGFVAGGSSRGSEMAAGSSSGGGRDGSLSSIQQEEGLSWGRQQQQQRSLDHPSSINRYQDGF